MSDFWLDPSSASIHQVCKCAGSPKPSLVAYVISTIISWAGSNEDTCDSFIQKHSMNCRLNDSVIKTEAGLYFEKRSLIFQLWHPFIKGDKKLCFLPSYSKNQHNYLPSYNRCGSYLLVQLGHFCSGPSNERSTSISNSLTTALTVGFTLNSDPARTMHVIGFRALVSLGSGEVFFEGGWSAVLFVVLLRESAWEFKLNQRLMLHYLKGMQNLK